VTGRHSSTTWPLEAPAGLLDAAGRPLPAARTQDPAPGSPPVLAPPTTQRGSAASKAGRYLIDDSLSLINKTGAYQIAKDLTDAFAAESRIRRWRLFGPNLAQGLARKVLARLLLRELELLKDAPALRWPDRGLRQLFLDPLYVLRAPLGPRDMVLCHDVGPHTAPELYLPATRALYDRAYAKIKAARPSMVFVSETSRRQFTGWLGQDFPSLSVIPLYLRNGIHASRTERVPSVQGRFLLCVGALERRKNHLLTIEAFAASGLAGQGVQLVICGSNGDQKDAVRAAAARQAGVELLGYVSDAQLGWLYQNALGFVLPSKLEGFGMPVLEAAAHGLPAIISSDGALYEAVGGIGVVVPGDDVPGVAAAMQQLVHMPADARGALSDRLKAHAGTLTQQRFLERWRAEIDAWLAR